MPASLKNEEGSYIPSHRWAYMEEAVDCDKNPFVVADFETKEAYVDENTDGVIDFVVPSDTDLFNYAPSCEFI